MSKKKNRCPFWSPTAGSCSITLDGLLIPLDTHISKYCNSKCHTQCKEYSRKTLTDTTQSEIVSDRRQYFRHAESCDITIIRTDNCLDDSPLHFIATVIDFSIGGIRLLLNENLKKDSPVTCSFGNEIPEHLRSGSAMIRWCEPLLNKNGFQAGLAFKDNVLPLAMSSYLSHP